VRSQAPVVALLLVLVTIGGLAGACARAEPDGGDKVTKPDGWREITLGDSVSFAVPADVTAQNVQPADSQFGILRGTDYEVVYDYGRYGEDLSALADKPGFTRATREVAAREATEVSFRGDGNPWGYVRLMTMRPDESTHLTIRVSCADEATCRMADEVFDSVRQL
jgi:hypothetical protein